MGQGNPESADAIFARNTNVFVADTLSQQNKNQSEQLGVLWVALKDNDGYKQFGEVLTKLGIPHTDYKSLDLNADLEDILDDLF